jgi:excisionase family DNA binding protein
MITASTKKRPIEQTVYTVAEVAAGLRLSDETVRRKIQSGELHALQIGTGSRKVLRILAGDLVRWLGPQPARKVFGIGEDLDTLERAFARLEPSEREALIEQALASAKAQAPKRELTGRTASAPEIAARFPKGR